MNKILKGDTIEMLRTLDDASVDLIFADPPYFLQLQKELLRPNENKFNGVDHEWDKFESLEAYDVFTRDWLSECKRVLKANGTIWVIGSYHNIFRLGYILQDLGYWILNDIIWVKTNPVPNFRGSRFNNAHETMIWASKTKESKFTFNYQMMKAYNGGKQMRSDWLIPICTGKERLMIEGEKAHPTQKPEALLQRIILSSSNIGDTVLDPFFGSGTTGAVAKQLQRNWIGIERDGTYVKVAHERIDKVQVLDEQLFYTASKRDLPRVSMANLVEAGYLKAGDQLVSTDGRNIVTVKQDGRVTVNNHTGSIHKIGAKLQEKKTCNGWSYWKNNEMLLDKLRDQYRREILGLDFEEIVE
ncbi:MAG: site-specific DNA-methyltransferase [Candidatus Heimdallarchaeota archaeon]|nr:site-specific DNA-methyltransferase [Candidatus Heimdallarchaeota archaeon]